MPGFGQSMLALSLPGGGPLRGIAVTVGIGQHSVRLGVLVLALACVGLAAWLWVSRTEAGRARRGRLRQAGWPVALVAVGLMLAATLHSLFDRHSNQWPLWVLILAAVVLVLVLRRDLAARVVAIGLIVLGLIGFTVVRGYATSPYPSSVWYGAGQIGFGPIADMVVLAQAYLLLLLGAWLGWRELRQHPAAVRLVLGRAASSETYGRPWGLLLLPLLLGAAVLASQPWWAIPLLVVAVVLIRRLPLLAGKLAAGGAVLLGAIGLVQAQNWSLYGGPLCSIGPGTAPACGPGGYALYGLVAVSSQATAVLADLEAVALIGLGLWLVPRTFPAVGRRLGLASAELTHRVQVLTESRAEVVDTAAADLRRLERDLHDGAQARLVAVGMSLRAAEKLIPTSPDAALALVAEARETSARALTELRELVRGVHPPVLADRGLADAVRALALDSPMRVETDIDLPTRLPAPLETACYFAVAEVLTNAAKHSGARHARIAMSHSDGVLRIEVTDFGLGGADPARGTGLAGVERRLATFDGILAISSPAGGPTIVVMEVPCALSSPKTSSS